jgi:hypothetical protein
VSEINASRTSRGLSGLLLARKLPAGAHVRVDTLDDRLDIRPTG